MNHHVTTNNGLDVVALILLLRVARVAAIEAADRGEAQLPWHFAACT